MNSRTPDHNVCDEWVFLSFGNIRDKQKLQSVVIVQLDVTLLLGDTVLDQDLGGWLTWSGLPQVLDFLS